MKKKFTFQSGNIQISKDNVICVAPDRIYIPIWGYSNNEKLYTQIKIF